MRRLLPLIALPLLLAGCNRVDPQADRLDNAADQADPAAAAVMRNEADAIRRGGGDAGNLADPDAPVQQAMENAGAAAAGNGAASDATQAKPHRAGDPVPPPQTR